MIPTLKTQAQFVAKLTKHKPKKIFKEYNYEDHWFNGEHFPNNKRLAIRNKIFSGLIPNDCRFSNLEFENCEFVDCRFTSTHFDMVTFRDCVWYGGNWGLSLCNSEMMRCRFEKTMVNEFRVIEADLVDVSFSNSNEIIYIFFNGDSIIKNVTFTNSFLVDGLFQQTQEVCSIAFDKCILLACHFTNLSMSSISFRNSMLVRNIFSNCTLTSKTIAATCSTEDNNYSSIDLHTINNSASILPIALEKVFGITEPDIKGFVQGLTRRIELQSAFISYSFKDKEFAQALNQRLLMKGVITFLWEKDAPGGRSLTKIMSENVYKHERLVFIASKNSIRSEACQFELSEGRKKQDKNWETILFPIHIDNYLFDVELEDIRPREKQNEYWKNIQELRSVNSIDFSAFNKKTKFKSEAFNKAIEALVKALRKESNA